MDQKNTYIVILIEVLRKKELLLGQLASLTSIQKEQIQKGEIESALFEDIIRQKEVQLDELNKADDGFEMIYGKVKQELLNGGSQYQNEIKRLQELIQSITDKSVELQTMERRNQMDMERVLQEKKQEIKEFHVNNRSALSYYKNMASQYPSESFFVDKKK